MKNIQLRQWLKDNGVTQEEAARATGYTVNYVNAVVNGRYPLSGDAILKFVEVYPATAVFLLPQPVVKSLMSNGLVGCDC